MKNIVFFTLLSAWSLQAMESQLPIKETIVQAISNIDIVNPDARSIEQLFNNAQLSQFKIAKNGKKKGDDSIIKEALDQKIGYIKQVQKVHKNIEDYRKDLEQEKKDPAFYIAQLITQTLKSPFLYITAACGIGAYIIKNGYLKNSNFRNIISKSSLKMLQNSLHPLYIFTGLSTGATLLHAGVKTHTWHTQQAQNYSSFITLAMEQQKKSQTAIETMNGAYSKLFAPQQ